MSRWPIGNLLIIAINVVVFALQLGGGIGDETVERIGTSSWDLPAMLMSCFLHADILHLAGNMLFLWTFGNAVCAALGTWRYLVLYVAMGVISSAAAVLGYGVVGIGASGAINGIIGFYLVLFPLQDVSVFWFFFFRYGVVEVAGFWLVLLWLLFDIIGASGDADGVGYWAHIGGCAAGIAAGFLMDALGWTLLDAEEQTSILALATGRHSKPRTPDPFRGRPRDDLIRELPNTPIRRPPPGPKDDSPIPMD